ncbi:DUF6192 family protein [Streptomyces sp. NPDC060205]|uniref:DUF6192 family protein n=1 Tax=Streptomyces sp. NPDC060205 TaxID=3347072 RepID=UPI00364974F6
MDTPRPVQEKVEVIHHLAQDEEVAARVTTDFLHRPDVFSALRATGHPASVQQGSRRTTYRLSCCEKRRLRRR